ncbi:hypothetical protein RJ639_041451 [Escallonia herrerae]|uniref:DAGKc domain-containing protein n=1 Tax=Escallonia herrerae TaxID=1293975 RepID=A0AA88WGR1_9ASTE|nr:hypothetical protein RJ639_041451 [Escallonia herrerae]
MERDSAPTAQISGQESILSSNFFLDHIGEVVLTFNSDGLSWKLVESICNEEDRLSCLGIKLVSKTETAIEISDVYAVEFIDWGLVHESVLASAGGCLMDRGSEMYRFTVHGVQRSKTSPSLWAPSVYTFGHNDLLTCQMWVNRINASLNMDAGRPKNLLVFVHPRSGKGNGCGTWEAVAPIFSQAKVKTKVIVTQRAGHAFDVMASMKNRELMSYDGVVAVGGDGFFNEILNGLLLSRHKAPYPPTPTDFGHSVDNDADVPVHDENESATEPSDRNEDHSPLLPGSELSGPEALIVDVTGPAGIEDNSCDTDHDPEFSFPNDQFRFGIIPAGSTDAIVICTTGARDPMTSALHIVLGKRSVVVCLHLAKKSFESVWFLIIYGFYGDVITESERYRWMGPKRYDYAGTKVFLRHRSYEAEVAYVDVEFEKMTPDKGLHGSRTKALHLTHLARKGGNPLNFEFVEHHKVNILPPPPTSQSLSRLRNGVSLERGPFDKRTADYVWMFLFGALSLLVMALVPFLWSPCMGASLVFMIVYIWSREFPNERLNIHGLFQLQGFYLPWYMLGVDMILGNPLKPDMLGIAAGHLYYFLTVLYPLSTGKNYCKTPIFVHKLVARWGEGFQLNSPVQEDAATGVAFRGRSYRLNGTRSTTTVQDQASAPGQSNPAAGGVFRGRSRRLDGR